MRALLLSLIASITTATSAFAIDMRGLWLDNKAWDGVQAVVQMYDCEDGVGLCARAGNVGEKIFTDDSLGRRSFEIVFPGGFALGKS